MTKFLRLIAVLVLYGLSITTLWCAYQTFGRAHWSVFVVLAVLFAFGGTLVAAVTIAEQQ